MSDHQAKQVQKLPTTAKAYGRGKPRGQALLEYVMILALAFIGLVAILTITGPAIGNVFSRTVYDLLGQTTTPQEPLEADEFWDLVTAVASYTPDQVDLITNTPAFGNDPSDPPTPTPVYSPTPTRTPVPTSSGPSATPQDDIWWPYDDDASNDENWQSDFPDILSDPNLPPWNAEWWTTTACTSGGIIGNIFNATNGSASAAATTTSQEQLIDFPRATHAHWNGLQTRPAAGLPAGNHNFCARFANSIPLQEGAYTFRYRRDEGVRIFVDGTTQLAATQDWNLTPTGANAYVEVPWVNSGTRNVNMVIQFRDTTGDARLEVELYPSGQSGDTGDCNWGLVSNRYNSAPTSWHDSPGGNYTNNQQCILRLRGEIDLTRPGITNPFLEFSDAYNLAATTDSAIVSISGSATPGVWINRTVHRNESNLGPFGQQSFDLSAFPDDSNVPHDFRNELIQLRFILVTDSALNADGWYIDDISVDNRIENVYNIGFSDAMDSGNNWVSRGGWALSNENVRSNPTAWSDSPGGNYAAGSNNILELNGRLDLTLGTIDEPQITFWHAYDLAATDAIYLEISRDRNTWQMITPGGSATYLARSDTQVGFAQMVVPIPTAIVNDPLWRSRIYIRFRIQSDGSNEALGWWVDDVEFRNRPSSSIRPNWCDNMEAGGTNWVAGGDWRVTNLDAHAGSQSWTDSPGGNYIHDTNNTLELLPAINLTNPAPAGFPTLVRPVLEFWHRWAVGNSDSIYVEISTDGGATWTSTNVWSYTNGNARLPRWGSSTSSDYTTSISWQRDVVELSSWIGRDDVRLRFRVDARVNTGVADGWYIDDICIREASTDPTINLPFADDFEGTLGNWYAGGNWAINTNQQHSGVAGVTESPSGFYFHDSDAVLELRYNINLTGTVEPTLYYWERYDVGDGDSTRVEYMRVNAQGVPQTDWNVLPIITAGPNATHVYEANLGWVRKQINLAAYIGQIIRIRFRLDGLQVSASRGEGWELDDISVVDRNGIEQQYTADPYYDDLETISPGEWVYDHNWGTVLEPRSIGSGGGALGPGNWNATYIRNFPSTSTCAIPDLDDSPLPSGATIAGTEALPGNEIAFDWSFGGAPTPILPQTDRFGIIFRRTVVFTQPTTLNVFYWVDDGFRMYDNGLLIHNDWGCNSAGSPEQIPTTATTFTAGTHNLEIHYVEISGSARIGVTFQNQYATGAQVGPGPWQASWFDSLTGTACSASAALPATASGTSVVDRLDFNWGTNFQPGVGLTSGNTFGARFQMTLQLDYPTTYQVIGYRNDAFRIYNRNGAGAGFGTQISAPTYWQNCPSDLATPGPGSFYSFPYTFPAGSNLITVEYYENNNNAHFQLGLYTGSLVFHDSPPSTRPGGTPVNYEDRTNTSVTLEGQIYIGATTNPALIWEDSVLLDLIDYTVIEVSADEGFQWVEVYRRATDNPNWTERLIDLTAFRLAGANYITIRFRLDALMEPQLDDGWFIDNIRIID